MSIRLIPRFGLAILCATVVGCTATHSSGPSTVRVGFTPLTDPPARGQGRMLVHPFTDHHPNGPQDLPGARDAVVIAPDQTLAKVMTDAFANAGRFAGYEVVVGTEAPAGFRPQVEVDGDIQVCKLNTDHFAGMSLTTHNLELQVRMTRPDNPVPIWSGNITGNAAGTLGRDRYSRLATYETMLRDGVDVAMWEWIQALNPASAEELRKRNQQKIARTDGPVTIR